MERTDQDATELTRADPSRVSDEGEDAESQQVARYIAGRLVQGVVVVLLSICVSFILVHVSGNPALIIGGGRLSPEDLQALERTLGYDRPLLEQFTQYFTGVLRADFGISYRSRSSALIPVIDALPTTLVLVATTVAFALTLGVPTALFSILQRDSRIDRIIRRILIALSGIPDFWLALMLLLLFAATLRVLPSFGFNGPASLVLPATALALPLIPTVVRLLRGELLDVMNRPFIAALRARGLTERELVTRHAIRNVLPPTVTFLALQLGWLLGGTLVIESIFGWGGIGSLALDAVNTRDLPVVQALVVVTATTFVVANLLTDLFVLWIDPRARHRS